MKEIACVKRIFMQIKFNIYLHRKIIPTCYIVVIQKLKNKCH